MRRLLRQAVTVRVRSLQCWGVRRALSTASTGGGVLPARSTTILDVLRATGLGDPKFVKDSEVSGGPAHGWAGWTVSSCGTG